MLSRMEIETIITKLCGEVTRIFPQDKIDAILFGSYARGTATPASDIDFLVDTTGTGLTSLLKLGALYMELEAAFGKPIDLITVSSIQQPAQLPSDAQFKNTVWKERVSIYDAA